MATSFEFVHVTMVINNGQESRIIVIPKTKPPVVETQFHSPLLLADGISMFPDNKLKSVSFTFEPDTLPDGVWYYEIRKPME